MPDVAKTLREIIAQEAKLREKKEACRQEAIKTVNNLIAVFGLKANELAFDGQLTPSVVQKAPKEAKKEQKVKPKYCAPDGTLWTGRGRMPVVIRTAVEAGAKLEDFLIEKSE